MRWRQAPARLHWTAVLAMIGSLLAAPRPGLAEDESPSPGENREMLVINEDDSHFFGSRPPEQMTREGLHALVDQYANTAVTHLFLCPNAMRTSFRSQSRDAIWDPVGGKTPQGLWPDNARLLFERDLDPYEIWITRCRQQGLSPWLSMRMNDVHNAEDPDNFLHSTFWRQHPEFWRVPHGNAAPWTNRALNYAHREVREHQLALVRELLERYDPDGLELDWMRFGHHLTPGREREEADILTDFVREVRTLTRTWAARRGHPIRLGARVPTHPDAAAGLGMDGVRWARSGLVDLLVPSPFWTSSDFDIPVELWKERLGDATAHVMIAPGLEHNARPWPNGGAVANDLASAYGFAAAGRSRGADGMYLFNWMDSQTRPVDQQEYVSLLQHGLGAETIHRATRRHVVCYRDTVPAGFPNGACLPAEARDGFVARIHIGPRPTTGHAWLIAGLAPRDQTDQAPCTAQLNGQPLGPPEPQTQLARLGGQPGSAIRFALPLAGLQAGFNDVQIGQPGSGPGQQLVWVEVRVEP